MTYSYDHENFTVCKISSFWSKVDLFNPHLYTIIYVFPLMCAQIEDEGLNAEDPVLEEDLPPEPEPEPEIGIRSTRTQRVSVYTRAISDHPRQFIDIDCLEKRCCVVHSLLRASNVCISMYVG